MELSPVSIIVPTYKEALNIPTLIQQLSEIQFNRSFEVIIVDDNSQDGIEEVVTKLKKNYQWLSLIIRKEDKGLSKSIIKGLTHAKHPLLVVMDADLSHPPQAIPLLLAALEAPGIDIAIGSRYAKGSSIDAFWPWYRKLISFSCLKLAKMLLPFSISDPLAGFIAIRKNTFQQSDPLNPIGWKISLELMLKCHCKKVAEIPIRFSNRQHGKSKLNIQTGIHYLQQLLSLFLYKKYAKK